MALEVEVRQWGNSKAIILPKEFVKERGIKNGEKLIIEPVKKIDITKSFGIFKSMKGKIDAQQMKDESRKGWE